MYCAIDGEAQFGVDKRIDTVATFEVASPVS